MFDSLFNRKLSKARKQGKEWVHLARKIEHFRRDVIAEDSLADLRSKREALQSVLKSADRSEKSIAAAVEELEPILRKIGGSFYPRNSWTENVDMIVVAAIVAVGIRTFFLQPFKIPTNSMYPTYNGLTAEVYFEDEHPGAASKLFRIFQLGAGNKSIPGEEGEELILPLMTKTQLLRVGGSGRGAIPVPVQAPNGQFQQLYLAENAVKSSWGMRFVVLPGPAAFYRFIVGENQAEVRVPVDFPMTDLVREVIEKGGDGLSIERNKFGYDYVLRTGIRVPEGADRALSFDVLTGDMLFVDRFTYNFRKPQAGEPFVFNTTTISGMDRGERGKYYIKRIGGAPGDTIEVRGGDGVKGGDLYRNGEPATESAAFVDNAEENGEYEGYGSTPRMGQYPLNRPRTIPERSWFAMGDNSDNSSDSRAWGYVPEEAIVGKAIFIYYPFSHRWGISE